MEFYHRDGLSVSERETLKIFLHDSFAIDRWDSRIIKRILFSKIWPTKKTANTQQFRVRDELRGVVLVGGRKQKVTMRLSVAVRLSR